MQIIKLMAGIILLGGAAWATLRTYKARGKSSWVILMFAVFLVAMGLYFVIDVIAVWVRDFRVGPEWIR